MPRGLKDEFMRARGRIPRHCRSCGKRFYVRAAELENAPATEPKAKGAAG
jgi:hypothetical protein